VTAYIDAVIVIGEGSYVHSYRTEKGGLAMFQSRTIGIVALMLGALAFALPNPVLAKGKKAKTTATRGTRGNVTPPTGAGPGEAMLSVTIAPVSVIEKRGHVDNMCESQEMMNNLVNQYGTMRTFGDYKVAYLAEAPKGWYEPTGGRITWRPPAQGETQHLDVVVLDSLTNTPIYMSGLTLDVVDSSGNVVQSRPLTYAWNPMASHYGANFSIPTAGTYSLRVRGPMPTFRRTSRALGNRFTAPLDATFSDVRLTPMRPNPTDMGTIPTGAGPEVDSCDQPVTSGGQDTQNLEETGSGIDTENKDDQPTTPPDTPDKPDTPVDPGSGSDNDSQPASE
jgi:hypothetical protein